MIQIPCFMIPLIGMMEGQLQQQNLEKQKNLELTRLNFLGYSAAKNISKWENAFGYFASQESEAGVVSSFKNAPSRLAICRHPQDISQLHLRLAPKLGKTRECDKLNANTAVTS